MAGLRQTLRDLLQSLHAREAQRAAMFRTMPLLEEEARAIELLTRCLSPASTRAVRGHIWRCLPVSLGPSGIAGGGDQKALFDAGAVRTRNRPSNVRIRAQQDA